MRIYHYRQITRTKALIFSTISKYNKLYKSLYYTLREYKTVGNFLISIEKIDSSVLQTLEPEK